MGPFGQMRDQPLQPEFGLVCQMCQIALSVPRAKISKRPSAMALTAGPLASPPPRLPQPLQPEFGLVCQMCQIALSVPRAKISIAAVGVGCSGDVAG